MSELVISKKGFSSTQPMGISEELCKTIAVTEHISDALMAEFETKQAWIKGFKDVWIRVWKKSGKKTILVIFKSFRQKMVKIYSVDLTSVYDVCLRENTLQWQLLFSFKIRGVDLSFSKHKDIMSCPIMAILCWCT